ncbi:MAG: ABC transporter permease, partial [Tepidiformaceae bacterium]
VVAMALPLGLAFMFAGGAGVAIGSLFIITGLFSPWFYALRGSNFAAPASVRTDEGPPSWPWILGLALPFIGWIGILPFYLLTLLFVRIVRDRKPASLPGWMPAVGIVFPPFGLVVALLQDHKAQIIWSVGMASAFGIAGVALTYTGLTRDSQFPFFLGISLIVIWVAVTLRFFGMSERLAFTGAGATLLVFWYLPTSVWEAVAGELNGDIEMFFLSGMVMVTAGTFIVVYNADIVLPAIAQLGSRFGRLTPAIRTAVAYPLTSRFRTGMTMAMIGLIMFSLVMMATINHNFAAVFLNEDSKGGFDVIAIVNENSPVDDLLGALSGEGVDTSQIDEAALVVGVFAEVENRDGKENSDDEVTEFLNYQVYGADPGFFQTTSIPMKYRASGYATDAEVWGALASDPSLGVLNAAATLPPDPFAPMDDRLSLEPVDDSFEPFMLEIREPGTESTTTITIIGQMKDSADVFLALGANGTPGGIMTSVENVTGAFSEVDDQRYYLKLGEGADSGAYARTVEAALVQASAESLDDLLDEQQSAQNGFLLVFQGFMGLGLVVGIAALGVVASRAVVERRQQIGMLRAIGYQRSMVALSFLFESGFIAISGILLGLTLGLSLAWVLFSFGESGEETENAAFLIPWLNLAIICTVAFVASMLMTFLPARAASRVPVADSLRYE